MNDLVSQPRDPSPPTFPPGKPEAAHASHAPDASCGAAPSPSLDWSDETAMNSHCKPVVILFFSLPCTSHLICWKTAQPPLRNTVLQESNFLPPWFEPPSPLTLITFTASSWAAGLSICCQRSPERDHSLASPSPYYMSPCHLLIILPHGLSPSLPAPPMRVWSSPLPGTVRDTQETFSH